MNKEALIKKWLNEELTETELKAFKSMDDYDFQTRILKGAQQFKASEVSEVADLDSFYQRVKSKRETKVRALNWYQPMLKIAAVITVVFGVSMFFFLGNEGANISTAIGEKNIIELPDHSQISVNAQSALSYNKDSWDQARVVKMKSGEAFFKVTKGRRFDVITEMGKVTVLGTQFNIKNRAEYFEIACVEGLVTFVHNQTSYMIPGGSMLKIKNGEKEFTTSKVSAPSWIKDVSSFKSTPLKEVLAEFQRQYDVTFVTKNIDQNIIFTGGFVHNNVEDGLKSITLPLDLSYSIDTNSGTITLRKVEQ